LAFLSADPARTLVRGPNRSIRFMVPSNVGVFFGNATTLQLAPYLE